MEREILDVDTLDRIVRHFKAEARSKKWDNAVTERELAIGSRKYVQHFRNEQGMSLDHDSVWYDMVRVYARWEWSNLGCWKRWRWKATFGAEMGEG